MAHNIELYHCLTCGKVVRSDGQPVPPVCCDCEMIKAAEETVPNHEEEKQIKKKTVGGGEHSKE